jgi:hypothetical protein
VAQYQDSYRLCYVRGPDRPVKSRHIAVTRVAGESCRSLASRLPPRRETGPAAAYLDDVAGEVRTPPA